MGRTIGLVIFLLLGACSETSKSKGGYGGLTASHEQRFCGDRPEREGSMLSISIRTQECPNRCWAAVLEMVGRYYGKNLRECDFAGLQRSGLNKCCGNHDCDDFACNQPASEQQIENFLTGPMGLHTRVTHRALSEPELKKELSNGRPVMIGFGPGESAHVALVTGFTASNVHGTNQTVYRLADPWPELGAVQKSYDELISGPNTDEPMPWSTTWYRISKREDGCNEQFDPLCGCEPPDQP